MRKLLFSIVALAAIPVSAFAADIPMKAAPPASYVSAPTWTGLYIGGQLGWGWASQQTTVVTNTGPSFPPGSVSVSDYNGPLGGIYGGYNYQFNQYLIGIDGDISASDLTGTSTDVSAVTGAIDTHNPDMKWLATATGRLGYVSGDVLYFAKGGWAWAQFDESSSLHTPGGGLLNNASSSETRDGWTAGGGLEWAFASHWSAKLEYDYVKFDTANYNNTTTTAAAGVVSHNARSTTSDLNILKGGVAFRF